MKKNTFFLNDLYRVFYINPLIKNQILLACFLIVLPFSITNAQTNLLTESFETDGEGTRYISNTFQTACHDFFERIQDSDISTNNCVTNTIGGEDGTFFWGGEDTDAATGGEGIITFNAVNVSGFNLSVDVLLAIGRPNDGRFEAADYFILEYNMDNAGWNIFGAMYGDNHQGVASQFGNLREDTNLDGSPNVGSPVVNSSTFQNFNFTIPVTGTSCQIRIRALANTGTEEILIDNIRLEGTAADSTAPVFENSTPSSSAISNTGFTLGTDIDEAGTIYYVVLADGATAPTAAEVKAGTGSGGASVTTSASQAVSSGGFTHDFNIAGLTQGTAYDVYVVAEDDEGSPNLQTSPSQLNITTSGNITWDGSTNNDWNTAANWNTNTIPTASNDIVIPSGLTNYPTAGSAVTISSVTMASGTSLIANSTFSGNVTYNRSIDFVSGNLKGWYLMSSPVSGEGYDDAYVTANDIASSGSNRGIASYTTSSDSWDYMQSGESFNFISGQGYSIKRGTSTGDVSFTGTLNVDNTGVDVVLSTNGTRFNFLGNPYTSYLASATFLTNEAVISDTQTLWVWNQTLSTDGAYEVKTVGDAFIVAPGQGFFVQANSGGGTFNFDESNQSHQTTDTFQRNSKTEIKLNITDGIIHNYGKIRYLDNVTAGFDVGYEGELFSGVFNPFAIYTHLVVDSQGKNYQTQSLPIADMESLVIPLGVNASSGMEISISVEALNLPSEVNVYLEDKVNNSFTRLDQANARYTVTLSSNENGIGRFFLHTSSSALSTPNEALENISMYTSSRNNLRIVGIQEGEVKLRGYNILGRQVLESSFQGKGVNDIELINLRTGLYIFQLETSLGKLNKKVIIK